MRSTRVTASYVRAATQFTSGGAPIRLRALGRKLPANPRKSSEGTRKSKRSRGLPKTVYRFDSALRPTGNTAHSPLLLPLHIPADSDAFRVVNTGPLLNAPDQFQIHNPRIKVEFLARAPLLHTHPDPEIQQLTVTDAIDACQLYKHTNTGLCGPSGVAALCMVGGEIHVQIRDSDPYIEITIEPQIEEIVHQLTHSAPTKPETEETGGT